jgi:hypothetical protein
MDRNRTRLLTFKHMDLEPTVIELGESGFSVYQLFAVSLASSALSVLVALTCL